jgi:hypothetical protein
LSSFGFQLGTSTVDIFVLDMMDIDLIIPPLSICRTLVLSYQYWQKTGKPVSLDFAYFMGKDSLELFVAVCTRRYAIPQNLLTFYFSSLGRMHDCISLHSCPTPMAH